MYITKSLVEETDSLNLISDLIQCEICKDLLNNPVQCLGCENIFCFGCFEDYTSKTLECPFKCKHPTFKPCRIANCLLDNFTFKCINECGSKIKYANIEEHYTKQCPKKNYAQLITNVLAQTERLKKQNAQLKDLQVCKANCAYHVKSIHHEHPLVYLSTLRMGWNCNVCSKAFEGNIKSYYCTLCDFDVCTKCNPNNNNMNAFSNDQDIYNMIGDLNNLFLGNGH